MIRVAVFARPPVAGEAKTRLAPAVGPAAAAELAAAFLTDTLASVARARAATPLVLELWSAGAVDDPRLVAAAAARGATLHAQSAGDLGARMRAAIDAGGPGSRALVIGSDAPTAPPGSLRAAAAALDAHDLVLAPTPDGGYWLLGARAPLAPTVLDGVPWSTSRARAATLAGAARCGLRVALLPPWYDVDTADDLRLLRAHLAVAPEDAPATAAALAALNVRPP